MSYHKFTTTVIYPFRAGICIVLKSRATASNVTCDDNRLYEVADTQTEICGKVC